MAVEELKIPAFILAGLAMMLNIRLSYSSAPYALIRFKLPENLFSVFVRRMASALELWCLPSMLLGNIMELGLKGYYKSAGYTSDWDSHNGNLRTKETEDTGYKGTKVYLTFDTSIIPNIDALISARQYKNWIIIIPSIISQWLNFLTYVILLIVYLMGGETGHLTAHYWIIAFSGFNFGIEMVLVYAADWNYTPVYIVGENSFPIVTSFMHYITTLIFGNRRKWNSDFILVLIDIWVAIIISFVAAAVWTAAYGVCLNTEKNDVITYDKAQVTSGVNPVGLTATTITKITITDKDGNAATSYTQGSTGPGTHALTIAHKVGEAGAPAYFTKDTAPAPLGTQGTPGTIILTTSGNKTITITPTTDKTVPFGHIFTETFDTSPVRWQIISPILMVLVGMGLVYMIYPGIAPGMIVPFYLIDKIEMILLIATAFPPVIVATLKHHKLGPFLYRGNWGGDHFGIGSGKCTIGGNKKWNWQSNTSGMPAWHLCDVFVIIMITLAIIFVYSLHYKDSKISRAIINQPKMSTFLSILFYMSHGTHRDHTLD